MSTLHPGTTGRDGARRLLPARAVWQRYQVCDRTLDRWLANPSLDFPRPLIVNRRRYFDEAELEAWERRQAGKAA